MSGRILVVEDNALNRRLFTHVLELSGFEVSEAVDGPEALSAIAANRPDLVLLDLDLPRLNGLDVLRRLRRDPACADTPVLACSAIVCRRTEGEARALGAGGYLTKPVGPAVLVAHVAELVGAARGVGEG